MRWSKLKNRGEEREGGRYIHTRANAKTYRKRERNRDGARFEENKIEQQIKGKIRFFHVVYSEQF